MILSGYLSLSLRALGTSLSLLAVSYCLQGVGGQLCRPFPFLFQSVEYIAVVSCRLSLTLRAIGYISFASRCLSLSLWALGYILVDSHYLYYCLLRCWVHLCRCLLFTYTGTLLWKFWFRSRLYPCGSIKVSLSR